VVPPGVIEEDAYGMLNLRFSKALTASEDWTEAEGKQGAEEDFDLEVTGKGRSYLDYDSFFESIFEVVDIWCYGITSWEYAYCLEKLVFAIMDGEGNLRSLDEIKSLEDDRKNGNYVVGEMPSDFNTRKRRHQGPTFSKVSSGIKSILKLKLTACSPITSRPNPNIVIKGKS